MTERSTRKIGDTSGFADVWNRQPKRTSSTPSYQLGDRRPPPQTQYFSVRSEATPGKLKEAFN
jgi:hypothetical protein